MVDPLRIDAISVLRISLRNSLKWTDNVDVIVKKQQNART